MILHSLVSSGEEWMNVCFDIPPNVYIPWRVKYPRRNISEVLPWITRKDLSPLSFVSTNHRSFTTLSALDHDPSKGSAITRAAAMANLRPSNPHWIANVSLMRRDLKVSLTMWYCTVLLPSNVNTMTSHGTCELDFNKYQRKHNGRGFLDNLIR